jgi:hypothetical protein
MLSLSTLITAFVDTPTVTNGAALIRYLRLHPAEVRHVAPRHAHTVERAGRCAARASVASVSAALDIGTDPRIGGRTTRTESPRCY